MHISLPEPRDCSCCCRAGSRSADPKQSLKNHPKDLGGGKGLSEQVGAGWDAMGEAQGCRGDAMGKLLGCNGDAMGLAQGWHRDAVVAPFPTSPAGEAPMATCQPVASRQGPHSPTARAPAPGCSQPRLQNLECLFLGLLLLGAFSSPGPSLTDCFTCCFWGCCSPVCARVWLRTAFPARGAGGAGRAGPGRGPRGVPGVSLRAAVPPLWAHFLSLDTL